MEPHQQKKNPRYILILDCKSSLHLDLHCSWGSDNPVEELADQHLIASWLCVMGIPDPVSAPEHLDTSENDSDAAGVNDTGVAGVNEAAEVNSSVI